jgi:hypothetical protein
MAGPCAAVDEMILFLRFLNHGLLAEVNVRFFNVNLYPYTVAC